MPGPKRPQLVAVELEPGRVLRAALVAAQPRKLHRVDARGKAQGRLDRRAGEDQRGRSGAAGRQPRGQGQRPAKLAEADQLVGIEDEARPPARWLDAGADLPRGVAVDGQPPLSGSLPHLQDGNNWHDTGVEASRIGFVTVLRPKSIRAATGDRTRRELGGRGG